MSSFLDSNDAFAFGNIHHIGGLLFFFLLGLFLIGYAIRNLDENGQTQLASGMARILAATVILWTIIEWRLGAFDYREDLPLYLCNVMALAMPWFTRTRSYFWYEVFLFWILAGTLNALITPDLQNGFPHYNYIKYWTVHAGLVIMMFYATYVYGYWPTWKSIFKSFVVLQIYFISMLFVNYILGANYAYLNQKPEVASILDYFGEWPWYVIQGQAVVLPFFFVIFLFLILLKRITYS